MNGPKDAGTFGLEVLAKCRLSIVASGQDSTMVDEVDAEPFHALSA